MTDLEIATQLFAQGGKLDNTNTVFDLNSFYQYDPQDGLWHELDEDRVRTKIMKFVQEFNQLQANPRNFIDLHDRRISSIQNMVRSLLRNLHGDFFQNPPRKGILFTNGFVAFNESTGLVSLLKHAKENRSHVSLTIPFQEQATPKWDEILHKVFKDESDIQQKIDVIEEFVGACLLGIAPRFNKCLVLLGIGSNGKGTIQSIIQAIFPKSLVSTSNPQTWNREYDRAELQGKRLNITSELPEREMLESEAFKSIVEGCKILARIIRQAPFGFKPEAGHIFAANNMLRTSDISHGFYRRFIVIPFRHQFEPTAKSVFDEIVNNELPGIAYRSIKKTELAFGRGMYTIPVSSAAAIDEWKENANPVMTFTRECLETERTEKFETSAMTLWEAWQGWCYDTGFQVSNITNFGRRLTQIYGEDVKKRTQKIWYNLKLNSCGEEARRSFNIRRLKAFD